MPASCRRWDEYQCALIIITRSLTVLPSGKIIKVSRFSRCGTGVPRYHCGNDLGVPQFWDRDPVPAETRVCTMCPCPKVLGHPLADRSTACFPEGVRVQKFWDTESRTGATLVSTTCRTERFSRCLDYRDECSHTRNGTELSNEIISTQLDYWDNAATFQ